MCDLENRVASAPAREVGGEFAQPLAEDFLIPSPRRVPRAPGTATAHYTASGRQALSLIARALRGAASGYAELFLLDHGRAPGA